MEGNRVVHMGLLLGMFLGGMIGVAIGVSYAMAFLTERYMKITHKQIAEIIEKASKNG